jgi:hypothetical protein
MLTISQILQPAMEASPTSKEQAAFSALANRMLGEGYDETDIMQAVFEGIRSGLKTNIWPEG